MSEETEEFLESRRQVFQCLFDQADANKDGRVTESEFKKFTKSRLSRLERAPLFWSVVTSWCNCDCEKDSISWEDVNGTSKSCLYSTVLVEQAHKRLCK